MQSRASYIKNITWSLGGNFIPLLAALYAIPILINKLGNTEFGILTLVWTVAGYVNFLDFGVSRALTREVAKSNSEGKNDKTKEIIAAGLFLSLSTAIIIMIVIYLLNEDIAKLFGLPQDNNNKSYNEIISLVSLIVIPTLLTSALRGAMEGLGNFYESNLIKTILGILMFLAPVWAVKNNQGKVIDAVEYILYLRIAILAGSGIWLLCKINYIKRFERFQITRLLKFGSWVAISGIISPLMVYGDRLFVSSAVGVENLSTYSIPQEGLQRLVLIAAAVSSVLLPKFTEITNAVIKKNLYTKALRSLAGIMSIVCITATIIAEPVLAAWISEEFAKNSRATVFLLILGVFFNSLAQIPYAYLHAEGKTYITAAFHVFELIIYAVLLIIFVYLFQIAGAALAWTIRAALDFFLLHYYSKKKC